MPQIPARRKHIRQTQKRTQRNRALKERVKVATKAALQTSQQGDAEQVNEALDAAYKTLDKAAKAGVIHAGRASRKKSNLAKQVARSAQ